MQNIKEHKNSLSLSKTIQALTAEWSPEHKEQQKQNRGGGSLGKVVKSRAACVTVVNAWALPQCPLEVLVTQVTFAVLVAVPANQKDRQDMAEFIRGLFMQGEIHFDDYITRMRNLFPQEMGALSNDLQGKIASRLRCN